MKESYIAPCTQLLHFAGLIFDLWHLTMKTLKKKELHKTSRDMVFLQVANGVKRW